MLFFLIGAFRLFIIFLKSVKNFNSIDSNLANYSAYFYWRVGLFPPWRSVLILISYRLWRPCRLLVIIPLIWCTRQCILVGVRYHMMILTRDNEKKKSTQSKNLVQKSYALQFRNEWQSTLLLQQQPCIACEETLKEKKAKWSPLYESSVRV